MVVPRRGWRRTINLPLTPLDDFLWFLFSFRISLRAFSPDAFVEDEQRIQRNRGKKRDLFFVLWIFDSLVFWILGFLYEFVFFDSMIWKNGTLFRKLFDVCYRKHCTLDISYVLSQIHKKKVVLTKQIDLFSYQEVLTRWMFSIRREKRVSRFQIHQNGR